MPTPEDVKGVQRLNGFVNYLAKFLPKLSDVMEPLHHLTQKKYQRQWTSEQDRVFEEAQKLVEEVPVLRYYDPSSELTIQWLELP